MPVRMKRLLRQSGAPGECSNNGGENVLHDSYVDVAEDDEFRNNYLSWRKAPQLYRRFLRQIWLPNTRFHRHRMRRL